MTLSVWAPDGAPEIGAGDDLAAVFLGLVGADGLADGDVVVVTSKVVAKAEGQVREGGRDQAIADETVRVVARRGPTTIVRTRHGLTLAAAGVDASNVAQGHVVLLPSDPDASARALRRRLHELTGRVVGVVVTDTAGRAWREGQTDIAIGAAGLRVLESFAGRTDSHGNPLAVTAPAVADEIAGAAELAQGKLAGRPFAVVRGRSRPRPAGRRRRPRRRGPRPRRRHRLLRVRRPRGGAARPHGRRGRRSGLRRAGGRRGAGRGPRDPRGDPADPRR